MEEQAISTVLGLWIQNYFTDSEVVEWADSKIRKNDSTSEALCELSLNGPIKSLKLSAYEFPSAREFSFLEKFAIRLVKLDLANPKLKESFISWVVQEAMGEDIEIAEVEFSYQLEHRLSYDEGDPLVYFDRNVANFLKSSEWRLNRILQSINV